MENEKRKIRMHRIVWSVIFLLDTVFLIISAVRFWGSIDDIYLEIDTTAEVFFFITMISDIFFFAFFISSLFLSCKYYVYEGRDIIVYAGFYHHYMTVDGRRVDEHNTITSFTPIILSCTLPEGTHLFATVSLTNRISLKINDMLYTVVK